MAHGDYNCCAVCARKLEYAGMNPKHKMRICQNCQKALRDEGAPIITVSELIEWVAKDPDVAIPTLNEVGFKECHYETEVDTAVNHARD